MLCFANSLGMWTNVTTIVGFPNETKKDIEETFKFAKESQVDFAGFYLLSPIPSSDVAAFFDKHSHSTMAEEGLDTGTLTGKELKEIQKKLYQRFMLHKLSTFWFVFGKIKSWEDCRFICKMVKVGISILVRTFTMKNTLTLLYKHKR